MTHTKNELEAHIDTQINKLLALVPASERDTAYELLVDLDRATREHKLLCITDYYNCDADEWETVEPEYFRDRYSEPYQIPTQTTEADPRAFFLVTFMFRAHRQAIQVPGGVFVDFYPSDDDIDVVCKMDDALTEAALAAQLTLLPELLHTGGCSLQRIAVGRHKAMLSALEDLIQGPQFAQHHTRIVSFVRIEDPARTGFGYYLNYYERCAGAYPLTTYEGPFSSGFCFAYGEHPIDERSEDPVVFMCGYLLGSLLCFLCYPPENWDAG